MNDNGEPTDKLSPEALDVCRQLGVTATKVSEIIANREPAIYKSIQEGMERVNARATSNAQKVQKFTILERDFSIGGGELGQCLKICFPIKAGAKTLSEFREDATALFDFNLDHVYLEVHHVAAASV